jgi:hypothetical protein
LFHNNFIKKWGVINGVLKQSINQSLNEQMIDHCPQIRISQQI